MKKDLELVAEKVSEKLIWLANSKNQEEGWKVISQIEQFVTGYGKSIETKNKEVQFQSVDSFSIVSGGVFTSDQYHQRLYTYPLKSLTNTDFISLTGLATGDFNVKIISENEENSRLLRSIDINSSGQSFVIPPIATSEVLSGDSLIVKITAKSITQIRNLAWIATRRNQKLNDGLRIVLIRTFGNKNIVQENLERLTDYLSVKKSNLDKYLFIVYDATPEKEPLQVESKINTLYIHGGNYGGGGNASLMIAILQKAHQLCPEVDIDEVMLWDDDAVIEPQMFIRHDGFTAFRKQEVAHTGIVFAKTSPRRIQEYGAIWGSFFDMKTGQLGVMSEQQRQPYPYLVRFNRDITQDWDRKYIGSPQDVEFGTFIYISIPYKILQKSQGSIPFFLRNDDVELGLRLKEAGAIMAVNQNIFAWHEATHNIIGEFYASLHGMIVNSTYCELEKSWLIKNLMARVTGASSVGNTALLEAYKNAIQLFLEGPEWMCQGDVFQRYLAVSRLIGNRLKHYYQVPFEVVDVMKNQHKAEIHSLTNPMVRHADAYAQVVFYDAPNKRYLKPDTKEQDAESILIAELAELIGNISSQFEAAKSAWTDFIRNFEVIPFWERFFIQSDDAISLGEVVTHPYRIPSLSLTDGNTFENRVISSHAKEHTPELPEDFSAKNYYKLNPDVEAAGIDAAEHYLKFGVNEGRRYR